MGVFFRKPGDTRYGIRYQTWDYADGSGAFAGASVEFQFMNTAHELVGTIDGEIVDDDGVLGAPFSDAGAWADEAGEYLWEARVVFGDTSVATYPPKGFERMRVGNHVPDSA